VGVKVQITPGDDSPAETLDKLLEAFGKAGDRVISKAGTRYHGEVDALDELARRLQKSYRDRLAAMARDLEGKLRGK
jgi:hypothetical protein